MKINDSLQKHIEEKYGKSTHVELAIYALKLAEKYNDDIDQIKSRLDTEIRKISDQKGDMQ